MSARSLLTLPQVASHLGCSLKTVYNYIENLYFPVYERQGERGVLAYLDEVDAGMAKVPAYRAKAGNRRFGPNVRIIQLPARAEVVFGDQS